MSWRDLRNVLIDGAEQTGIRFQDIEDVFLDFMQAVNGLRRKGKFPAGQYRQKGNWWRDLMAALVKARCGVVMPDRRVEGLTDIHSLDMVYPDPLGEVGAPLIVVEAKMLGSPEHIEPDGTRRPERGGAVDLDKRLKEVKYTPIDLRLKYTGLVASDWEEWNRTAIPKFYSLWAFRVASRERQTVQRRIMDKMIGLARYYNTRVGFYLYEEDKGGQYRRFSAAVPRGHTVDEVIEAICDNVKSLSQLSAGIRNNHPTN